MLSFWSEFDRTFALMDELRRRMDQATDERAAQGAVVFPRATLWDAGHQLVLTVDLPGVTDKDINVELTGDVLTVSAERKVQVPTGYSVHRQERPALKFARSFTLPFKVDAEKIGAALKNGELTISLPKAPESQPRQIAVKAS